MHRKVRKNQQGSFGLQATAFVSFITKIFWSIKYSSCNNSKNTVFQSNQGSAGFSCNSSKINYPRDQQHNFVDVGHPQVCVLILKILNSCNSISYSVLLFVTLKKAEFEEMLLNTVFGYCF